MILLVVCVTLGLALLIVLNRRRRVQKPQPSTGASVELGPPARLDSFEGRKTELRELRELIGTGQITTITGMGGVGKTRIAERLCADYAKTMPSGCIFVDLADAENGTELAALVARKLGGRLAEHQSAEESVANMLANLEPALVVLDNFEQLPEPARGMVKVWVARAPKTRFLVTSREPLRLGGEKEYRLEPLQPPEADTDPAALRERPPDSVKLFRARARRPPRLRDHGGQCGRRRRRDLPRGRRAAAAHRDGGGGPAEQPGAGRASGRAARRRPIAQVPPAGQAPAARVAGCPG